VGNRDRKPLGDLDELQKPVSGLAEQMSSRSTRTFRGALGRPPPFPLSSLALPSPGLPLCPANSGIRRGKDDCASEGIESAKGMKGPLATRSVRRELKI
jgi:hypothetical protein